MMFTVGWMFTKTVETILASNGVYGAHAKAGEKEKGNASSTPNTQSASITARQALRGLSRSLSRSRSPEVKLVPRVPSTNTTRTREPLRRGHRSAIRRSKGLLQRSMTQPDNAPENSAPKPPPKKTRYNTLRLALPMTAPKTLRIVRTNISKPREESRRRP